METESKTAESPTRVRRHPLQVTAARIREALKDYPQVFDAPSRAVAELLARRMEDAVDSGVLEQATNAAPVNPGQPYDQRAALKAERGAA